MARRDLDENDDLYDNYKLGYEAGSLRTVSATKASDVSQLVEALSKAMHYSRLPPAEPSIFTGDPLSIS